MRNKTSNVLLATLLGLGGLGTGLVVAPAIAAAATSETTATAAVGDRLSRIKDALGGLVTDGTITQGQADRVATTLDEALPRGGPGGHHGGPGRHRGGPGGGRHLDTAATTLGMSAEELRTALEGGQSLAGVADSKGVSKDTLINALVEAQKQHLAEKVAEGDLTQAEADERSAELTAQVTDRVEREGLPARRHGRGAPPATTETPVEPSSTNS